MMLLKILFVLCFEAMLQGEMENHLGYNSNNKGPKKMKTEEMDMEIRH